MIFMQFILQELASTAIQVIQQRLVKNIKQSQKDIAAREAARLNGHRSNVLQQLRDFSSAIFKILKEVKETYGVTKIIELIKKIEAHFKGSQHAKKIQNDLQFAEQVKQQLEANPEAKRNLTVCDDPWEQSLMVMMDNAYALEALPGDENPWTSKQEKSWPIPDPVSFDIEVDRKANFKVPAVKKRLEEYEGKETTLESIKQKLAKADERRQLRFNLVLKSGFEYEKKQKDIQKKREHKAEQRK